MTNPIDNTDDIIDSRDIIARIEDLEGDLQAAHEENAEGHNLDFEAWLIAVTQDTSPAHCHEHYDAVHELLMLRAVREQAESYGDWEHGETLINEAYFTKYIEVLIDDCYDLPKELTSGNWPYRHISIDYEAAAEEAKQDYTEIDFDGVAYLMHS